MEINDNVKEVFIDVLFTFESLKKAFLIIEHEWDQDSSYKLSYIDLPMGFVEEYIDTLNLVLSKENFVSVDTFYECAKPPISGARNRRKYQAPISGDICRTS